jgi:hypothetical protein
MILSHSCEPSSCRRPQSITSHADSSFAKGGLVRRPKNVRDIMCYVNSGTSRIRSMAWNPCEFYVIVNMNLSLWKSLLVFAVTSSLARAHIRRGPERRKSRVSSPVTRCLQPSFLAASRQGIISLVSYLRSALNSSLNRCGNHQRQ